jgi:hypothetical protein
MSPLRWTREACRSWCGVGGERPSGRLHGGGRIAASAARPVKATGIRNAMADGVRYNFGVWPNALLADQVFPKADAVCVRRATGNLDVVRD